MNEMIGRKKRKRNQTHRDVDSKDREIDLQSGMKEIHTLFVEWMWVKWQKKWMEWKRVWVNNELALMEWLFSCIEVSQLLTVMSVSCALYHTRSTTTFLDQMKRMLLVIWIFLWCGELKKCGCCFNKLPVVSLLRRWCGIWMSIISEGGKWQWPVMMRIGIESSSQIQKMWNKHLTSCILWVTCPQGSGLKTTLSQQLSSRLSEVCLIQNVFVTWWCLNDSWWLCGSHPTQSSISLSNTKTWMMIYLLYEMINQTLLVNRLFKWKHFLMLIWDSRQRTVL